MSGVSQEGAVVLTFDGAVAAADQMQFVAPVAGQFGWLYATAGTAPVGADMLIDVHVAGTTIFTTQADRMTIADGGTQSAAATPDAGADFAAGDLIEVIVDQVGSTTAGSDVTVSIGYEGDPTP